MALRPFEMPNLYWFPGGLVVARYGAPVPAFGVAARALYATRSKGRAVANSGAALTIH